MLRGGKKKEPPVMFLLFGALAFVFSLNSFEEDVAFHFILCVSLILAFLTNIGFFFFFVSPENSVKTDDISLINSECNQSIYISF